MSDTQKLILFSPCVRMAQPRKRSGTIVRASLVGIKHLLGGYVRFPPGSLCSLRGIAAHPVGKVVQIAHCMASRGIAAHPVGKVVQIAHCMASRGIAAHPVGKVVQNMRSAHVLHHLSNESERRRREQANILGI